MTGVTSWSVYAPVYNGRSSKYSYFGVFRLNYVEAGFLAGGLNGTALWRSRDIYNPYSHLPMIVTITFINDRLTAEGDDWVAAWTRCGLQRI